MAVTRTTIMADEVIMDRVSSHIKETGENLSDFFNRALLNQLERDGDFEIRDEVEESRNGG